MIEMIDAALNIGRKVVYVPYRGAVEEGVITKVAGPWIFVRYGSDTHAKATAPGDLDFMVGGAS